ncbi:MAG: MarR family transcriptional regulator [Alphaproteobacteria bacterium]|nr:MarR family transcriptional regulator [Alphaproteobacteria bacterium]
MATAELARRIEAVRRFSRFYTARIGALREGLHNGPFPLTEARVLYELNRRNRPVAAELVRELGVDPGFLSRILARFRRQGLLRLERDPADARRRVLVPTARGRRAFEPLDRGSREELARLLEPLSDSAQRDLMAAMGTIERLLDRDAAQPDIAIREHRIGDMGWVVSRHGAIYAQEFGWNGTFEALVAEIAAKFIRDYDATQERSFIAELDGRPVGSAFVVRDSARVARLRMVLVEPEMRGTGLGRRLVREAERFARRAGYRRMTLWTHDVLVAARAIYASEGYAKSSEERTRAFGQTLVSETWDKSLE